jgi:hypothetical protein
MDTSLFLAQVFGLYMFVMGLSVLLKYNEMRKIIVDFMSSSSNSYMVGVFTFILGLLVVLSHNVWGGPVWVTLITVLGWLTLIKGAMYLLLSRSALKGVVGAFSKKAWLVISGLLMIILGIYLISVGFNWF